MRDDLLCEVTTLTQKRVTRKLKNAKGFLRQSCKLDWTHTMNSLFNDWISQSLKTEGKYWNEFGIRFFMQWQTRCASSRYLKVKALHYLTHCSLRQEKFTAAEIAGRFTIYLQRSRLCLKMHKQSKYQRNTLVREFALAERKWSWRSKIKALERQIHRLKKWLKKQLQNWRWKLSYKKLCVSKLPIYVNPFATWVFW